jgi:hypothetical protein
VRLMEQKPVAHLLPEAELQTSQCKTRDHHAIDLSHLRPHPRGDTLEIVASSPGCGRLICAWCSSDRQDVAVLSPFSYLLQKERLLMSVSLVVGTYHHGLAHHKKRPRRAHRDFRSFTSGYC